MPTRPRARTSYKAPRRGKFEIWSALLEACLRTPQSQSWLMRKVGLNTAAAKDALGILTRGELLEQVSQPTAGIYEFKTTEKGKETLAQYYQLITYFFETKQKRRSRQYMILPLLVHLFRLIFGQISLVQEHSHLQVGHSGLGPTWPYLRMPY